MTTLNTADISDTVVDGELAPSESQDDSVTVLAAVSVALSGMGFLTLLRLADRRERTPARALGLFLATSLETIGGTAIGLKAATQARDSKHASKVRFLGASGAVLGIVTTLMNFNWMRTRRRL
jgi:hypothetical protein